MGIVFACLHKFYNLYIQNHTNMKHLTSVVCGAVLLAFISCGQAKTEKAEAGQTPVPSETPAQKAGPNPESAKELTNFPQAAEGLERYVIHLDQKATGEEERAFQVELIPGKKDKVDCNDHFLTGSLDEKTLEGWGYTFYEFNTKGDVVSTMMGCPDKNLTEKFIPGQSKMVRYNSKLPIVVYLPKGYELQYKIWLADETVNAKKG